MARKVQLRKVDHEQSVEDTILDRIDRDQSVQQLMDEFPQLAGPRFGEFAGWTLDNKSDVMGIIFDERF